MPVRQREEIQKVLRDGNLILPEDPRPRLTQYRKREVALFWA